MPFDNNQEASTNSAPKNSSIKECTSSVRSKKQRYHHGRKNSLSRATSNTAPKAIAQKPKDASLDSELYDLSQVATTSTYMQSQQHTATSALNHSLKEQEQNLQYKINQQADNNKLMSQEELNKATCHLQPNEFDSSLPNKFDSTQHSNEATPPRYFAKANNTQTTDELESNEQDLSQLTAQDQHLASVAPLALQKLIPLNQEDSILSKFQKEASTLLKTQNQEANQTPLQGQPKQLESFLSMPLPQNRKELEDRLKLLLGRSVGELSLLAGVPLPHSNLAGKGFAGQLIELYLGASAHNLTLPDFTDLNIEMKTLPLGLNLSPVESTFLCATELNPKNFVAFEDSPLYHKLSCILFVLLLAPKGFPIVERRLLGYFFFTPNAEQLATIKEDYQGFAELVCSGQSDLINGNMGSIVQMRPKGLSGTSLTLNRRDDGSNLMTRPRGFYLRPSFTNLLCQQFFQQQGVLPQEIDTFQENLINDE